tara:strand:+ start:836 stop:1345 length:510 start_codon:yes stop_codon:yes gene_type:complete
MRSFITKLLAVIFMIGGILGFTLALLTSANFALKIAQHQVTHIPIIQTFVVPFLFLLLYSLTMRASISLYRDLPMGYRLCHFLLILQIPIIITPTFSYIFTIMAGAALGFIQYPDHIRWSFYWISHSQSMLNTTPVNIGYRGFYINLLPFLFIPLLAICKKLPQEEKLF